MKNTVVTVGRVSVDLYGVEAGASFGATKLFLKALVEVQATSLLRRQNLATKPSC